MYNKTKDEEQGHGTGRTVVTEIFDNGKTYRVWTTLDAWGNPVSIRKEELFLGLF